MDFQPGFATSVAGLRWNNIKVNSRAAPRLRRCPVSFHCLSCRPASTFGTFRGVSRNPLECSDVLGYKSDGPGGALKRPCGAVPAGVRKAGRHATTQRTRETNEDRDDSFPLHPGARMATPTPLTTTFSTQPKLTQRRLPRPTALLTLGVAVAFAATGCVNGPQTVATLPAPSFAAPTVTPTPPTRAPVAVAKDPAGPKSNPQKPAPPRSISGPKDWSPAVASRPWKWIVVHHSATPSGGAAAFDKMHKAKGWDGLGYDFVIGNGTDTRDGQVEVGYRWRQQLTGAHAKTSDNRFNELGIGICVVGNFDIDRPTAEQMKSLNRLVSHLMRTYRITPDRVVGHGDTKPTDCPGRYMNLATVRNSARQTLATEGTTLDAPTNARATANPSGELLTSSR
jgi:N-acetylmuramoyl-L-alanine amidase